MADATYAEGNLRRRIAVIALLSLILLGLLVAYWLFSRPPRAVTRARTEGYQHMFSIYGSGPDRLRRPIEVAVGKDGKIYVADSANHRIVVFDRNGNFVTKFGKYGKGRGEMEFPSAVAVSDEGLIYVLSYTLNKGVIYNNQGKVLKEMLFAGTGPLSVTIRDKKFYVTTRAGIMIGDLKGNLLSGLQRGGFREGELNRPTGIAVDEDGNIYVADSMNYRIQALNKNGKFLWAVGQPLPAFKGGELQEFEKKRKFGLPASIVLADDGNLYVMDAMNGEIVILNKKGKQLGQIGEWGRDDGQFYYPAGMAYAGDETFVVADEFNDRVQVIRIPSPTVTPVARAARYWPWLLLLLLPLLLLLLRRRQLFVVEPRFLDAAIDDGAVALLKDGFARLYVTRVTFDAYQDVEQEAVRLGEILVPAEPKEKIANTLADRHAVAKDGADVLALALTLRSWRRRVMLLCQDAGLHPAADAEDIPVATYQDFKEALPAEGQAQTATG